MNRKTSLFILAATLTTQLALAQVGPEITSWIRNTTATGYGGIVSNVQLVQYTSTDVYISASCIPGYSIGPWIGDPNIPSNQNFVYKITRTPVPNTGTPTPVGLGHVGVWTNGVSIFNTQDAMSYNNAGIWHQNAYIFEGSSFDNCLGHPAPGGEYHHHVSPRCLYNINDSTHHSPIIGYAFDGYPVYGAYGYADTNGTGGIRRMRSSFQLRSITQRHTLPDGTSLTSSQYGPDVSSSYPLGDYQEDYVFTAGSGDLDVHNGRWCKTPEYPAGTYCYFVTLDANLLPQYPYTIGLTYYGIVQSGNTGPTGGHNTPPGGTIIYNGTAAVAQITGSSLSAMIYPNPSNGYMNLFIQPTTSGDFTVTINDMSGRTVFTQNGIQPTILYSFNVTAIPAGSYIMNVRNGSYDYSEKIVIAK
jgi:YHYH protein/Secretion system C-terminal sorting domain